MSVSRPRLAGLFLVSLATLLLELLNVRLLSVASWYHLSFFAVSMAMFGMAAGAVRVYLRRPTPGADDVAQRLADRCTLLAAAIPVSHLVLLVVPAPATGFGHVAAVVFVQSLALSVPFFLSGEVVTEVLCLQGPAIGRAYAVDLLGAAMGCLAVAPILERANVACGILLCAASAALAASLFRGSSFLPGHGGGVVSVAFVAAAAVAGSQHGRPTVFYAKGQLLDPAYVIHEFWNVHSQVLVFAPALRAPLYWGPGLGADRYQVEQCPLLIDGVAGTTLTRWDGSAGSLEWVEVDVTSLPYALRRGGTAAIVGVGGGRDVLTALRAGSRRVVGVEINRAFLDLLQGEFRDWAGIAGRPQVQLVHDEARSALARTAERFDVVQMSLTDTWSASSAGAFTLTENGLYTVEGFRTLLGALEPHGILAVSRWFSPGDVSETDRLTGLAVAALLDRGVATPRLHIILAAAGRVATLLVSPHPFSPEDLEALAAVTGRFGFSVLASPAASAAHPRLEAIVASTSGAALESALRHPRFELTPPTDERPYFFNMLRPSLRLALPDQTPAAGLIAGNLRATNTLLALAGVSLLLVLAVLLLPLAARGLAGWSRGQFWPSAGYFSAIGMGFMILQVSFMQRFSVYLGHPVYALVVVLFSMILLTGVGSFFSDRLQPPGSARRLRTLPLGAAAAILLLAVALRPALELTLRWGLPARGAVVVALIAPVSLLLGTAFPVGFRLVGRFSQDAPAWMWGINGAASVFGATLAVAVSLFWGIRWNFVLAAGLYGSLAVLGPVLFRSASDPADSPKGTGRE